MPYNTEWIRYKFVERFLIFVPLNIFLIIVFWYFSYPIVRVFSFEDDFNCTLGLIFW